MSVTEIYSKPNLFYAVSTGYKSKNHTGVSNLVTKKFHSEQLGVWQTLTQQCIQDLLQSLSLLKVTTLNQKNKYKGR